MTGRYDLKMEIGFFEGKIKIRFSLYSHRNTGKPPLLYYKQLNGSIIGINWILDKMFDNKITVKMVWLKLYSKHWLYVG